MDWIVAYHKWQNNKSSDSYIQKSNEWDDKNLLELSFTELRNLLKNLKDQLSVQDGIEDKGCTHVL